MTVVTAKASAVATGSRVGVWPIAKSAAAISVGLYALAFVVRAWAVGLFSFPLSEGSAYYVAAARSLATGRGLVVDTIWSYATPPLVLPRPAFELWQPTASLVAAIPMSLFGTTYSLAQVGGVFLGALLAPLAWLVARDTVTRLGLPERRAWFVAVGAGALVAVAGPFLLSTAIPDSYLPFTIFAVAACIVMPAAATGSRRAIVGLGVLLALAYLTRMEVVWLGMAFVVLTVANRPHEGSWRPVALTVARVALIAAFVAVPWWLRNLAVFGTALPGQIADNLFLTRNEQIYAYLDQPTLAGFLAQGLPVIAGNVAAAFWHDFVDVLIVPAAPLVIVGLLTVAVGIMRRRHMSPQTRRGSLAALLVSGAGTLVATSLLFPVATMWGTFEHASGPLLVGLTVAAVIGGDAFVAWLVRRRDWQRQNAWMAPAALLALTVPLTLFTLGSAARQASAEQRTFATLAASVPPALAAVGVDPTAPIISDRPVWLSDALGRSTLALSDEPVDVLLQLATRFGATAVVVVEGRGDYPQALRTDASGCFTEVPVTGASVFAIDPRCMR